eukprot:TRINITY_DN4292_c0_g1_i1.p1 TRINITY_DN4292_c0_g1~~TRINITY_DN4292_c0_g1_i1.p1  ORF type:complete len:575 (+),score=194.27 TRINITY_DN4292_c0_g1_i1:144-1868(+)
MSSGNPSYSSGIPPTWPPPPQFAGGNSSSSYSSKPGESSKDANGQKSKDEEERERQRRRERERRLREEKKESDPTLDALLQRPASSQGRSVTAPPPTSSSSTSASSSSSSQSKPDHQQQKRRREEMEKRKVEEVKLPPKAAVNNLKKPSEFVCNMKFRNNLPAVPFDPKILSYPFDPMRFVKQPPSSLETTFKYPLLAEADLGIAIDLIDPETYKRTGVLAKDDEVLINPPAQKSSATANFKRPKVTWLRKTEYMATDSDKFYGGSSRSALDKQIIGKKTAMELQEAGELHTPLEQQIIKIERMFDEAKQRPVHPTNPSIEALEIVPVLPNVKLWGNKYTQLMFDSDPTPDPPKPNDPNKAKKQQEQDDLMSRAVIKTVTLQRRETEAAQKYLIYMIPKSKKSKVEKKEVDDLFGDDEDDEKPPQETSEDYVWTREYLYTPKKSDTRNFFFVLDSEKVLYNPIHLTCYLQNVKSKTAKQELATERKSVTLHKKPMTEDEKKNREEMFRSLLGDGLSEEGLKMLVYGKDELDFGEDDYGTNHHTNGSSSTPPASPTSSHFSQSSVRYEKGPADDQ